MPTLATGICNSAGPRLPGAAIPNIRHSDGPPPCGPSAFCRGFTLIELLVVVLLIGIIVSFAALSVGQHASRSLRDEAERITSLIRLAGEEAVLQSRELGVEFRPTAYRFITLEGGQWLPVEEDRLFRERELPDDVRLRLSIEGVEADLHDSENPPRVLILSSGEMTPFELRLANLEGEAWTLSGDFTGRLELVRSGEGRDVDW